MVAARSKHDRADRHVRSPLPVAAWGELVQLGRFLDTYVEDDDGEQSKFTARRALLLWSESARALVVLEGFKIPRGRATDVDTKAGGVYRRWTRGRAPTTLHEFDLELRDDADDWADRGDAISIGYESDKFHAKGDARPYEHKFGRGVRFYTFSTGRETRGILVWRGGKLRVTKDGIEG